MNNTNTTPVSRLLLAGLLLGTVALVGACSSPSRTTTTEQTTTRQVVPVAPTSTTSTTTTTKTQVMTPP